MVVLKRLHSAPRYHSAPLSKRSSTAVSVRVNPAAVRRIDSRRLYIHGWSSGAGYAALNHRRPRFRRRRSTSMEQSSSRSVHPGHLLLSKHTWSHICSTYPFLQFDCIITSPTVSLTIFVQSSWNRACAVYASLNLSLLHYITLPHLTDSPMFGDVRRSCRCGSWSIKPCMRINCRGQAWN